MGQDRLLTWANAEQAHMRTQRVFTKTVQRPICARRKHPHARTRPNIVRLTSVVVFNASGSSSGFLVGGPSSQAIGGIELVCERRADHGGDYICEICGSRSGGPYRIDFSGCPACRLPCGI
jgi:hypothetical protein